LSIEHLLKRKTNRHSSLS